MRHDFTKHGYNEQAIWYKHLKSTAVLTPELNTKASMLGIQSSAPRTDAKLPPVSKKIKESRKRWCLQQANVLKNNPSNAVFSEDCK